MRRYILAYDSYCHKKIKQFNLTFVLAVVRLISFLTRTLG